MSAPESMAAAARLLNIGRMGERLCLATYITHSARRFAAMSGTDVSLDILAWAERQTQGESPGPVPESPLDPEDTAPAERDEDVRAIREADKGRPAGHPTLKLRTVSDRGEA